MFRDFPSYEYYANNSDPHLDFLHKSNIDKKGAKANINILTSQRIIFTIQGMKEITDYYQKKYNITIHIIEGTKRTQPKQLRGFIDRERKVITEDKLDSSTFIKKGIIFFDYLSGHASVIAWEKTSTHERIYYFGGFSYNICQTDLTHAAKNFKDKFCSFLPNIELWMDGGKTLQLDYSSCTIIALSQVKDYLLMKESLYHTIINRNKYIKEVSGIHFYYPPEELLKVSQKESSVSEAKSDLEKIIHMHRVKDLNGKLTQEEKPVSLREFRENYAVSTFSKPGKYFGSYTLHKGVRYTKIIEEKWKKHREIVVPELLEMLATTKAALDKVGSYGPHSSNTPGNRFLDLLRNDATSNLRPLVKKLELICSAIIVAQNPPDDCKIDSICKQNAIAAEQLLCILLSDKNQPTIRDNFKKFLEEIESFIFLYPYANNLMEKSAMSFEKNHHPPTLLKSKSAIEQKNAPRSISMFSSVKVGLTSVPEFPESNTLASTYKT